MNKQTVTVFTSEKAKKLISSAFSPGIELLYAGDITDCFDTVYSNRCSGLIIELMPPYSSVQDLMYDFQKRAYFPSILLFSYESDGSINYTLSDSEAYPFSGMLAAFFESAFSEKQFVRRVFFRTTDWENNYDNAVSTLLKREALEELLRGCTEAEFETFRKKYDFNINEKGCTLFFWELQNIEYAEHKSFKDIHNFCGEAVRNQCAEIIRSYSGGEVFYIGRRLLCAIINDIDTNSSAKNVRDFEKLLSELCIALGSKYATRYLSGHVTGLSQFRTEYEKYLSEKSFSFFRQGGMLLRSTELNSVKKAPKMEEVSSLLETIGSYLHYDPFNPELDKCLERLFLVILKFSLDYPLYYYCVSVINSDISRYHPELRSSLSFKILSPGLLQFSSIEKQYLEMKQMIASLREKLPTARQPKSALVRKVLEYISANYMDDISVPDISKELYISPTYLSQIFKGLMGVSVISYIIDYRIGKAKELLEDTDLMVYAIADKVGFRDVRHFSKTFKKIVGCLPTEYRKKL